jgi:hypothetical protein
LAWVEPLWLFEVPPPPPPLPALALALEWLPPDPQAAGTISAIAAISSVMTARTRVGPHEDGARPVPSTGTGRSYELAQPEPAGRPAWDGSCTAAYDGPTMTVHAEAAAAGSRAGRSVRIAAIIVITS